MPRRGCKAMTLEACAKLIHFRECTKLFLHREVARGEPVSVAEHLDGVVSRSQSRVDIPVDRHLCLVVGIFHLSRGGGLHRLAVDMEIASSAEQGAFGRDDTHVESLHARRRRIVGTHREADAKLASLGYMLLNFTFLVVGMERHTCYVELSGKLYGLRKLAVDRSRLCHLARKLLVALLHLFDLLLETGILLAKTLYLFEIVPHNVL